LQLLKCEQLAFLKLQRGGTEGILNGRSHQFTRNEKHTPAENVGNPALQQLDIQNTGHSHIVQIWGNKGGVGGRNWRYGFS